jgi:hypothetical protein
MFSFRIRSVAALILLSIADPVMGQHGARTASRNIADLTERADVIVQGRVVSALSEPHPKYSNLMTVVVTLVVQDTLKGNVERIHTFRQFVWDERDSRNALGYRKGEEVLLLLNHVNENGLTSTVGLEQGRFRIERDATGKAVARNGQSNLGLFDGLTERAGNNGVRLSAREAKLAATRNSGPVSLDDLKAIIRSFAKVQP